MGEAFSRAKGHGGTTLLRDRSGAPTYATVDCWESMDAMERFKQQFGKEYADLDAVCEKLTESEGHLVSLAYASDLHSFSAGTPFSEFSECAPDLQRGMSAQRASVLLRIFGCSLVR
ncbi:MAG: hypothetical protein DMG64_06895 [Acidobacteria bacterium]|nr:MAG: hypothetical protein DMG64_06895 [Acidobacteriota bacterium]PYY21701.1 MAG: hypothetical protein DMG62_17405 [Acidobacteriota bacterium]